MAFRQLTASGNTGKYFNSDLSCNFKSLYDSKLREKYSLERRIQPSPTFAPSSFRCNRLSYFRLRGVTPDVIDDIDTVLEFSAMVGTACHREIQSNLKEFLGDAWVDVESYLVESECKFEYNINSKDEFETRIEFVDPPIKFSCDGILAINNEYVLLEIKTCNHNSFKQLSEPKQHHIDQVKCYCSLLNIHKVLMIYQDREYGDIKCYEFEVTSLDMQEVLDRMRFVLKCVQDNIAPDRLPAGDYWCSSCKYKLRCKQWG